MTQAELQLEECCCREKRGWVLLSWRTALAGRGYRGGLGLLLKGKSRYV